MNNFEEIFEEIKKHHSFYLSGHKNPDGDSKGSCECLRLCLEALGTEVLSTCGFTESAKPQVDSTSVPEVPSSVPEFDCFIQLDVQPDYRIPKEALEIKKQAKSTICFDHHLYEGSGCDFEYVEPEASACALIVWDFVKFTGVKITKEIATAAYFGLCSDTNSFMNTNSDERSFKAATEMMSYGVNASEVAQQLFQSRSLASFELEKVALEHLYVDEQLHFAFSYLTAEDYKKYNATKDDSDAIIDLLRELETVEVACVIRQEKAGEKIKGSLRSKGHTDVTKLAKLHTGGGHKAAAGFTTDFLDMPEAVETVKTQLSDLMNGKI